MGFGDLSSLHYEEEQELFGWAGDFVLFDYHRGEKKTESLIRSFFEVSAWMHDVAGLHGRIATLDQEQITNICALSIGFEGTEEHREEQGRFGWICFRLRTDDCSFSFHKTAPIKLGHNCIVYQ